MHGHRLPRGLLVLAALAGSCGSQPRDTESDARAQNALRGLTRASEERTHGDLRSVALAIQAYASQSGEPPRVADLDALASLLCPTYLRSLPREDGWGHPLVYEFDAGREGWRLRAPGKDGQLGTPDDMMVSETGFTLPEGYRPVF